MAIFNLSSESFVFLIKEPDNVIIFSRDGWFMGPFVWLLDDCIVFMLYSFVSTEMIA